jgi:hypothetical protein
MDDYTLNSSTEVGFLSYVCLGPDSHNEFNAVQANGQPVKLDNEHSRSSRESRASSPEDELKRRIDSEISAFNELLRKLGENAKAITQKTSIDANITPQATLDADITGQRYHASEDKFIPIDSLFKEICGNDDDDLATNDLTVQDARAADQAFATTSPTDQIVTEKTLTISGNEIYEDAIDTIVVSGKLACHPTADS